MVQAFGTRVTEVDVATVAILEGPLAIQGWTTATFTVKRDGANDLVYPQASTIRFKFPERGEMPACDVTWYDGTDNKPVPEISDEPLPISCKSDDEFILY